MLSPNLGRQISVFAAKLLGVSPIPWPEALTVWSGSTLGVWGLIEPGQNPAPGDGQQDHEERLMRRRARRDLRRTTPTVTVVAMG